VRSVRAGRVSSSGCESLAGEMVSVRVIPCLIPQHCGRSVSCAGLTWRLLEVWWRGCTAGTVYTTLQSFSSIDIALSLPCPGSFMAWGGCQACQVLGGTYCAACFGCSVAV